VTLVLPEYGRSALTDVLPSVATHLGVPQSHDVLGIPVSSRYVLLLVDGLGWTITSEARSTGPMADLGSVTRLTAGVPSTTVTSVTSLGTGLTPGQHGIAGFSFRQPETSKVLNALLWHSQPDPVAFQPHTTVLQRATAAGVGVTRVLPAKFEGSGLTQAGLRGGRFLGETDAHAGRIAAVRDAATSADRTLVYHYVRELDHTGHGKGVGSSAWRWRLNQVGRFIHDLRASLPDDVVLLVTGDHGMIDAPGHHRLIAEDDPMLMAGVDLLAGEARFRHLYTRDVPGVADRWATRLDDRAWVRTREQAVAEGWFGPLDPRVANRFGDVVVAMRTDWAVLTTTFPKEHALIGMHGSLTEAEMAVPLFIA